jgi:hypothetical protein
MILAIEVDDEVQLGSSVNEAPSGTGRVIFETREYGMDLFGVDVAGTTVTVAAYEIERVRKYVDSAWQSLAH